MTSAGLPPSLHASLSLHAALHTSLVRDDLGLCDSRMKQIRSKRLRLASAHHQPWHDAPTHTLGFGLRGYLHSRGAVEPLSSHPALNPALVLPLGSSAEGAGHVPCGALDGACHASGLELMTPLSLMPRLVQTAQGVRPWLGPQAGWRGGTKPGHRKTNSH